MDLGMFNMNFSCAGDPGIHFEYEFSLRTWWRDYQVRLPLAARSYCCPGPE